MSEKDEREFLQVIEDHGDIILDRYAERVTAEAVLHTDFPRQFWIAQPDISPIVYNTETLIGGRYPMDDSASEVIELSLCHRGGNEIEEGRIYHDKFYVVDMQWAVKSKRFEDVYNYYHKWFRKQYRLESGKPGWRRVGPDAYRLYKEQGYQMKTYSILAEFD